MKRALFYFIVGIMTLFIAGCGYRFSGMERNPFPKVESMAIPLFMNNTSEPLIAPLITNALIYEFNRAKGISVLSEGQADAVLEGVVVSLETITLAHSSIRTPSEKRVKVTISLKLIHESDGEILWQDTSITEWAEYFVYGSSDYTPNRRLALQEVAKKISEKVRDRMFSDF